MPIERVDRPGESQEATGEKKRPDRVGAVLFDRRWEAPPVL